VIGDRHVWIYASRVNWRTCYYYLFISLFDWGWLLLKTKKTLFEPPFLDLGVTYTHSIYSSLVSPWSTLYSSQLTFFAISYGCDVISGNLSKSAFFEKGWSLWAQISDGSERRPPTTAGVRVAEWLPFRDVSKYPNGQTDGQTARITTPKAALAAARAVEKCWTNCHHFAPVDTCMISFFIIDNYTVFAMAFTQKVLMAEMCRVGDFKVWVTFRLNFRLKAYVSRQYLRAIR